MSFSRNIPFTITSMTVLFLFPVALDHCPK